ncbi:hypothetical protein VKT23_014544 [Stygiomarasmius scandens]|uniref:Nephrocystin 3-like N-terminal domain-containing protein n=1 Tax=Marasmiellus scandens TaxID=2682957 RepID=A0ABR1J041_9AGAR
MAYTLFLLARGQPQDNFGAQKNIQFFSGANQSEFLNTTINYVSGNQINSYDKNDNMSLEQKEKKLKEIYDWMKPSNPSQNYNQYLEMCTMAKTGEWFINSPKYKAWKETPSSMMWLQGEMGCGKSVLVSTVIKDLEDFKKPDNAIAYYYFDFRDASKQGFKDLIVSLIIQLSLTPHLLGEAYEILKQLYDKHKLGTNEASIITLRSTLMDLLSLSLSSSTQIVIDALDEMEGKAFQSFMELMSVLDQKKFQHLHVLVTSRPQLPIASFV